MTMESAHEKPGAGVKLLFGATIFLSAFLLFQVQPMIGKIILPWFGGTAAVWTTCMVFFQVGLLAGYLYAHALTTFVGPRVQCWLHVGLLTVSLAALPLAPNPALKPTGAEEPMLRILLLLTASVGLPYFLLSTTGPLVQAWLARAWAGAAPYRLFALSNAGSMLALLTYPTLVEPFLPVSAQTRIWSAAFAAFVALCVASGFITRKATGGVASSGEEMAMPRPTVGVWLLWLLLPACGSTLLLAVTNHLTQNVAPVPFLWVLPLSLYVLSFIICFERDGWYRRWWSLPLGVAALAAMAWAMSPDQENMEIKRAVPLVSTALFVCCMICHGELARLKPRSRYLTSFYLMVAAGGAVGGLFVGMVAPRLFRSFWEMHIGLVLCAALALAVMWRERPRRWWKLAWLGGAVLTMAMAAWLVVQARSLTNRYVAMMRSFYGGLRVYEDGSPGEWSYTRGLTHGTIMHGAQNLDPDRRREPTTYFGPDAGVTLALLTDRPERQRVGVIGLGAGVIAAYSRPGDYYRFYEIDPLVVHVAQTQFTFLKDSPAKIDIVVGDGRLSLDREEPQNFDLLSVDAFSSDAVPVHLLTREAFKVYFRHLKPTGVLCVQVTNRYLDLAPVVELAAHAVGKRAILIADDSAKSGSSDFMDTDYVLVTGNGELFEKAVFKKRAVPLMKRRGLRTWTDDYSNLFRILN